MLRSLALASLFALVACAAPRSPSPLAPSAASDAPTGRGIALGFRGAIETDVELADLTRHDYAISAWVLPQDPHGYEGPFFAPSESGNWSFGLGDYRWGKGGYKHAGSPVVLLLSGKEHGIYTPDPELIPNAWRHVAMVRKGPIVIAYIDGKRVGDLPASETPPSGTLRIGARALGQHAGKTVYEGQFFGIVDDVAVFSRALEDAELEQAARPGTHPTGAEPGLVAAFTFEPNATTPALAHPYRLVGRAHEIAVSAVRDGAVDAAAIPLPELEVPLRLPFDVGQAWRVMQGNCPADGSHNGYACFAWDFVLAGAPHSKTRGQLAHAAGPGKVVVTELGTGNNWVKVFHAKEEVTTIMHLLHGSIRVAPDREIQAGEVVGQVGDTGAGAGNYHLHIAVNTNNLENGSATVPAAFSDYEVSDDEGKTWRHVALGVPQRGQWVKRLR